MCMARQAEACRVRSILFIELAQEDAARGSCRVARAVESGLRGRCSRDCARAVAHRAGGQQWAADAAGQDAILAGSRPRGGQSRSQLFHTGTADFEDGSGAEVAVF